ncbi:MAG TPA: hypothetical protein VM263_01700 [Acidimicrobiales bacterium]|nr:hypothetical protein [Acidimicrobiales bacterium]
MSRARRFGLRGRVATGFAATGLLVALAVALTSYVLARRYLLDQREDTATAQAYVHARLVRSALRAGEADVVALMAGIDGGNASDAALRYRGQWYATVIGGADAVPRDLVRVVGDGHAGVQRVAGSGGRPQLAVGVPVRAVDAEWYELFPLDDVDHTLSLLARSSTVAAVGAAQPRPPAATSPPACRCRPTPTCGPWWWRSTTWPPPSRRASSGRSASRPT